MIDGFFSIAERVVHEGVLANLDQAGHLVQQGAEAALVIATARLVVLHHHLRRWPVVVAQLAIASAVGGHAELVATVHRVLHAQAQVVIVVPVRHHVVMSERELTDLGMLRVLGGRLMNDSVRLEGADRVLVGLLGELGADDFERRDSLILDADRVFEELITGGRRAILDQIADFLHLG